MTLGEPMGSLAYGGVSLASIAAGIGSVVWWRRTGDTLIAAFAVAFWVLGLNWIVLTIFVHYGWARS
jgi:hypothetical protein